MTEQTKRYPKLNGMTVLRVSEEGTIFMRIEPEDARPIDGGCQCQSCKARPDRVPAWDTLAVNWKQPDHAWTVHCPDPQRLPL